MEKKNISDLVDAIIAVRPDERENAEQFVREFFNLLRTALLRERFVKVRGFGTFKLVDVSPRESINVNTGERIEIGGHYKVTFTPDTSMRDAVNSPFAHLQAFVINEGTNLDDMMRIDEDDTLADTPTEVSKAELPASDSIEVSESDIDYSKKASDNIVDFVVEQNIKSVPPSQTASVDARKEEASQNIEDVVETEASTFESFSASEDESAVPAGGADAEPQQQPDIAVEESLSSDKANNSADDNTDISHAEYFAANYDTDEQQSEKRSWIKYLLLAVVGILLLTIGYIAGYNRLFDTMFQSCKLKEKSSVGALKTVRDAKPKAVITSEISAKTSADDSVEKTVAPADAQKITEQKQVKSAEPAKKHVESVKKSAPHPILPVQSGDSYMIVGVRGTYTIKRGDGIIRLAKREYGDKSIAKYILRLNDFSDPDNIPVGAVIKLPELAPVVSE